VRHKRSPTLFAATKIAWFLCVQPLALGATLTALAQTAPAAAQTAGASSAEYNRTMGAAQRAFNLHHWDDALQLYEQAHALKPNARTLRGMGACQFELHRFVAAAGALTQALLDSRSALSSEQRNATADLLARASAAIGSVQLELTPRTAELMIDGVRVDVPPSGELMQIDPGHHELSARAPGYELLIVQVEIVSGTNAVTLTLPQSRAPVLAVAAPVAAAPVSAPPPEAPSRRKPLKRGLIVTGAILGGGGLIAATTTGLLALTKSNDLHDRCPNNACAESEQHALDKARKLALISNVMWGVTAAGAGVLLIGILLSDRHDKQSATLGVGPSGVSLHGNF
jgi:hypothetical protein